ncbi:5'-nucleotidase C-terminal domain-containing protein [Paracoccus pacificus]|uniref:5'-nucleotidase C-terminal domain-containing protein n=1 Tax=Paracoccus pacificus TaxID=1463598 RepID=A0ABW4RBK0_9RHOB
MQPVLKDKTARRADLRILATTDLHAHVLAYDYFSGKALKNIGLTRVERLVARHRAEAANSLLFDNGDFLQGNPLGDFVAERQGISARRMHPVILAMNALGYDAGTLGNHDFTYGLKFLRTVLALARFPIVSANIRANRQRLDLAPWTILDRRITLSDGGTSALRIGVIGFLPPQTSAWETHGRGGALSCTDIVPSAAALVPRIRAAGADIVVALAHSGIAGNLAEAGMENAATALADVPGIDAIIAGHIHRVFPDADFPALPGTDPALGRLGKVPAVMPGFWGSHLGIIDLALERRPEGWTVTNANARVERSDAVEIHPAPIAAGPPACGATAAGAARLWPKGGELASPVLAPAIIAAHRATLRHAARKICQSAHPMTTHFAQLGQSAALDVVARAQRWHARRALKGSRWDGLPIISAVAAFRAGGRGGPENYTNIAAGPVTLGALSDLYAFPNTISALCMTGAQAQDWLERAAGQFRQLQPGISDQPLIQPEFPSYHFDLLHGLNWRIDLSQPAKYHPDGSLTDHGHRAGRISDLRHHGRPIDPDEPLVMVTNGYRLSGWGLYAPITARAAPILPGQRRVRDILQRYLTMLGRVPAPYPTAFSFAAMPRTSAWFDTAPGAGQPGTEPPPGFATAQGPAPNGFHRWRIAL